MTTDSEGNAGGGLARGFRLDGEWDEQQQHGGGGYGGHPILLPERVVSRDDVYINSAGNGRPPMMNTNTNNNNNRKAKKRRVRHDLPGPAGSWFRRQRPQKMVTKKEGVVDNNDGYYSSSHHRQSQSSAIVTSSNNADGETIMSPRTMLKNDPNSPSEISNERRSQQQQQRQALFHDHTSDLHECNAWNMMCVGLNRIVPRPEYHYNSTTATTTIQHSSSSLSSSSYKNILRTNVSNEYALIHEIHEGKYDIVINCGNDGGINNNNNNTIDNVVSQDELHLPLLVGYVANIHCHDHSDWTALLVDEMYGAAAACANPNTNTTHSSRSSSSGSSSTGKGIVCWIEEKLVKRNPNWIRPGCVWCIEGAKLALFASDTPSYDNDDDGGEMHDGGNSKETSSCTRRDGANTVVDIASSSSLGTIDDDISPSTESTRAGGQIDRMILVGEYCMVYAWTPEEASSALFGHDEFINLMERRLGLGLSDTKMSPIELLDEDNDDDGACIVGSTNITNNCSTLAEVGNAGSWNSKDNNSRLNKLEHTANTEVSDGSFAAITTKSTEPRGQCNVEVRPKSSSPIVSAQSQPHGENNSTSSPRVTLASLPFPHIEDGNDHCDDGNDESKICDKTIVTAELLVVQSTDCVEDQCNEQKHVIENVSKSARDNELLRITPPRGKTSSPTPKTTNAERNSGSCPPANANTTVPLPVSCETASSVSCNNIINDNNQNQQQCKKAPSELKILDTFDDDDALDDELLMLDTTSSAAVQAQSYSTPKAASNKQHMYSQQLQMDTGDSFDYMLDEDDDNSCPGDVDNNDKRTPAVRVQQGRIKPTSDCPDNEIKSSSNPTIPVLTRGASLFDSLDGDDLDFLNEDE